MLLCMLAMSSCKCHDEACSPGGVGIEVRGFDPSELKNIVLRRYDTAGFYVHLLETIPCREIITDTVNGVPHTLLSLNTLGNFNWELVFPAIQKTVRIYNLTYEHQTQQICNGDDKPFLCTSPITSYNQDGVIHNTIPPQADHAECIQIQR